MRTGRRRKRAGWRRRATALRRLRYAGCDSPPAPPSFPPEDVARLFGVPLGLIASQASDNDWCACPDDAPAHSGYVCPHFINH